MGVTEGSPSVRSEPETQIGMPHLPTSLQGGQGKCLLEEVTESLRYKEEEAGTQIKNKKQGHPGTRPPRTAIE